MGKPKGGDRVQGLFFTDRNHGWAVGDGGLVMTTSDGAESWSEQSSGTNATLRGAFFLGDRQHGWVVGDLGTVLGTSDDGGHWTALTLPRTKGEPLAATVTARPLRLPAPWYWLSFVALGLLIGPALRAPAAGDVAPESTIANLFVTDRPVEDPRHDRLALNNVALGLSRFLRNDSTAAPLTVAVTGDWGAGKSSLMKLLQTDLLHFGFRPVWFNAWHYQKEEHMLAGLLQAIRLQAVPGWLSIEGLQMRARLLLARGWQFWFLVGSVAFALSLSIAFEARSPDHGLSALDRVWSALIEAVEDLKAKRLDKALALLGTNAASFGKLGGVLTLLETFRRGVRAFGVDPAALLAGRSGPARQSALSAKTSLRQKFAAELASVTQALGVRKMIIFIDDSGSLPARARRRDAGGSELRGVVGRLLRRPRDGAGTRDPLHRPQLQERRRRDARRPGDGACGDEHPGDAATTATPESPRQKRARFAREYLDKLINIEIPVPVPTPGQAGDLLLDETSAPAPTGVEESTPEKAGERPRTDEMPRLARLVAAAADAVVSNKRLLRALSLAAVIAAVAPIGAYVGAELAAQPSTGTTRGGSRAPESPLPSPSSAYPPRAPAYQRPDRTGQSAEVAGAAKMANPTPEIVFAGIVLLLALSAWIVINRRPDPVVRDSEGFKKALRIWKDVVYARRATPRSLKRFVNRVRYLAMGQRVEPSGGSLLDKMLAAASGAGESPPPSQRKRAGTIDDQTLVALAAIHEVGGDAFVNAAEREVDAVLARDASVRAAWNQHAATFKMDVSALSQAAAAYARQARSVRAN